ncbi:hypothetical protein ACJX0J_025856, partial [Zea mays]
SQGVYNFFFFITYYRKILNFNIWHLAYKYCFILLHWYLLDNWNTSTSLKLGNMFKRYSFQLQFRLEVFNSKFVFLIAGAIWFLSVFLTKIYIVLQAAIIIGCAFLNYMSFVIKGFHYSFHTSIIILTRHL